MNDPLDGLRQHLADAHQTYVGPDGFTFETLEIEHSGLHAAGDFHEHDYPRPDVIRGHLGVSEPDETAR